MTEEREIPWQEILEAIFRRKRIVFTITLLGISGAIIFGLLKPPTYKAVAKVQLTEQALSGPRAEGMSDKQIQAELALLKSEALIRSLLEDRGDFEDPSTGVDAEEDTPEGPETAREEPSTSQPTSTTPVAQLGSEGSSASAVQSIAKRIDAVAVGRSNLVEVSFLDRNPERAARFVNRLLELHIERIAELNEQSSALSVYQKQRDVLAQKWLQAVENLRRYREEQGADYLAGDEKQRQTVVAKLQADKISAETEYLELQARIDYLKSALIEYPKTVVGASTEMENEAVRLLEQKIMELEIERSQKLSLYTPTSKIVRDLDRQIEEAQHLLEKKEGETLSETTTALSDTYKALEVDLVQTQAKLTSAAARIRALTDQLERYRVELKDLESAAGELARLESEVENAKEAHQNYQRKEEQARFSRSLDESLMVNMIIVEKAEVPTVPEPTDVQSTITIWAIFSLLVGLVAALVRDWLDPSIKGSAQVARLTKVPTISQIPAS